MNCQSIEKIEKHLAYLSSFYNTKELGDGYDVNTTIKMNCALSDIFIVSLLCELDDTAFKRVIDNINSLVTIACSSTQASLAEHPRYVKGRAHGFVQLANVLKSSRKLSDE